jgi:hypothetical protein
VPRAGIHAGENGQIDAVRLNVAVDQRPQYFIVAAGKRQL